MLFQIVAQPLLAISPEIVQDNASSCGTLGSIESTCSKIPRSGSFLVVQVRTWGKSHGSLPVLELWRPEVVRLDHGGRPNGSRVERLGAAAFLFRGIQWHCSVESRWHKWICHWYAHTHTHIHIYIYIHIYYIHIYIYIYIYVYIYIYIHIQSTYYVVWCNMCHTCLRSHLAKSIKSKWQSHAKRGTLKVLAVLQVIEEPQAAVKALSHEIAIYIYIYRAQIVAGS